jgi:hypothetical protein
MDQVRADLLGGFQVIFVYNLFFQVPARHSLYQLQSEDIAVTDAFYGFQQTGRCFQHTTQGSELRKQCLGRGLMIRSGIGQLEQQLDYFVVQKSFEPTGQEALSQPSIMTGI